MSQKYKNLMSPLKVRNFILKNRLSSANSLPHFLQGPETYPADSVMAHFENRAKGAAITTCMGINNFTIGKQFPMDMDAGHFPDYNLYDCNSQNYLMQLADAIHFYDSIACMALYVGPPSFYPLMKMKKPENGMKFKPDMPMGKLSENDMMFGPPPMAEFEIEKINAHGKPEEYDEETLNKICDSYAEQAWLLQTLGYEMVSIHYCYRANLPSKFLSPLTNKRSDKFGGSLENRMRFPLMVLERVRNKVGNNFLIEIELSAEDRQGGYTLDDTVAFLNEAKKYIDIVQLRASEINPAHPIGFDLEETPFLHYSEYVKERVEGLVIGTIGGYHYIDTCEKAIAEGKADLICMARAWISNPNYFDLVKEGRGEDLVPCLRCNKCHGRGEKDPFVSVCSVNPIIGLEHKINRMIVPVTKKKKVAIVGGGPGGMRCALYLIERGHEVTIYEAGEMLGGAIKHSDYVPFKWPLRDFKNFLINQVLKQNITVKMNTMATPEMLSDEKYDVIVTALGAVPAKPPILGIDKENVFFAEQAFIDPDSLGKNVVVIGGGEVGVETAMFLCQKGHNATVLEMRNMLAEDATKVHYRDVLEEVWESIPNFSSVVNATVTQVKEREVCYKDKDGIEHSILCDSIVVSAGMNALTDEALNFAGIADEFYMIGDCKTPATIQQTMRSAFSTAMRI